jgi:hypothetical protein
MGSFRKWQNIFKEYIIMTYSVSSNQNYNYTILIIIFILKKENFKKKRVSLVIFIVT